MRNEPRLTSLHEPETGAFPLDRGGGTSIGRAPSNTICLRDDESVSRLHAKMRQNMGLYWLEDLGSANGSYLAPPGGEELKLAAGEAVILIEGSRIRIGLTARFEVTGLLPAPEAAEYETLSAIHARLSDGYAQIIGLPPDEKTDRVRAVRDYEARIAQAENTGELTRLAAEKIQQLTKTVFGSLESEGLGAFGRELPPLDHDLPDPAAPRPMTVKGTLLPGMLEQGEDKEES